MAFALVAVNTQDPLSLGNKNSNALRGRGLWRRLMDRLKSVTSKQHLDESWMVINSETQGDYIKRAGAVCTFATGTGAEAVVVNGTTVSVTWATSDANTYKLLETAIAADATAKTFISAHRRVAKLTTATAVAGNTVTFGGVTFTAQASAATLGTGQWDIQTSDTASGLSLAVQINAHPKLVDRCFAVNVAGVVYIALLQDRYARADEQVTKVGAPITVNSQIAMSPSYTLTTASAIATDTVTIFGHTFTAVSAAVTAGTLGWDIRTSDTAAAVSLAAQINAYAPLKTLAYATSAVGVVTLYDLTSKAVIPVAVGGTVTVALVIDGAGLVVLAHVPGKIGNACTLTVTGTNFTANSLVSGKLGGGSGGIAIANVVHSNYR